MEDITKYVWFQEGPGVRKEQYTSNGVKLLNVANLVDGKVDLSTSDRFISKEEANGRYKHFLVDEGDLIIASSGIQVSYFDKKMGFIQKNQLPLCMNTSTIRFKSLDKNVTNIRYFMYFLKSELFKRQLQKQITGSAQLNFGPSHLKKMKINMPSIEKQNKIVEKLDKIQNIIDLRNKQLNMLKEVVKSQFVEMFGELTINDKNWLMDNMGNYLTILTDFSSNGSYKTLDSQVIMYDKPNYAYMVRTTDLENDNYTDNVKYIDENSYNLLSKSKVYGNEIIMCKIGSAGKCYLMPKLNRKVSLGRNAFLFRYNDKINTIFMNYLLNTDYGKSEISKYVRGAVTKTITKDDARKIRIIVPPIELQNKFASFVELIDKQEFEIKESLTEMENLYNSLMNEYFG